MFLRLSNFCKLSSFHKRVLSPFNRNPFSILVVQTSLSLNLHLISTVDYFIPSFIPSFYNIRFPINPCAFLRILLSNRGRGLVEFEFSKWRSEWTTVSVNPESGRNTFVSGEDWNDFGESGHRVTTALTTEMDANPRPDNWAKAALPRRESNRIRIRRVRPVFFPRVSSR